MDSTQPAPAIEVQDLWVSYNSARYALQRVDLRLEEGEVCMVLGPSGSGKSTLLKAIKGLLKPSRGRINAFGLEVSNGISGRLRRELGSRIAYVPQNLGLVRNLTVLENTLMGALSRTGTLTSLVKAFREEDVAEARERLRELGIAHKENEKVFHLSGGERQRVAIARALLQHPRLVLADEFVSQLDPMTTRDILDIVAATARRGIAFLITSHEIELVAQFGDRAVFLRDGEKVHECPAREVNLDAVRRLMGRG
jgi:phosphonate transport system ATP-binding protein